MTKKPMVKYLWKPSWHCKGLGSSLKYIPVFHLWADTHLNQAVGQTSMNIPQAHWHTPVAFQHIRKRGRAAAFCTAGANWTCLPAELWTCICWTWSLPCNPPQHPSPCACFLALNTIFQCISRKYINTSALVSSGTYEVLGQQGQYWDHCISGLTAEDEKKKYPIRKKLCFATGHRDAGNDNTGMWEEKSQNSQLVYFQ